MDGSGRASATKRAPLAPDRSPRRRLRAGIRLAALCAAVALLGLTGAPAGSTVPSDRVYDALEGILAEGHIQTDLPGPPPPAQRSRSGGGCSSEPTDASPEPQADGRDRSDDGGGFGLLETIVAILLAAVLGYILIAIAKSFRRRRRGAADPEDDVEQPEPETDAAAPLPADIGDPVADAMRLAEAGRLIEAVRLLLRAAVDLLRARGHPVDPALTSREILRTLQPGAGSAEVFGGLVRAVERALFRREAIDREDVRRCAESFVAFRNALTQERP